MASDVANVLYATIVHSEQSVADLRDAIGTALSMAEQAIGHVDSCVQSLGSHVEQISSDHPSVCEQAQRAEMSAENLVQQLRIAQQEQITMQENFQRQNTI